MEYTVILPTLNENGHITKLINSIEEIFKIKKKNYEIIIVDDNSTDGTTDTVSELVNKNKKLKLIVRSKSKKNLAQSINEGIEISKYENIIWMDADFQHPPKYINDFIDKSNNWDAIICSRFLQKSERYFNDVKLEKDINENQSYIYNKLCRILLFKEITDYTSGYICIKKKIFKDFRLSGFYGDYFVSLLTHIKKKNYTITEIPFKDDLRASGFSKTVVNINMKYLYTCTRYILTLILNFLKKII
tara:strand:+ start:1523 stop:2260 length:738 start_codon:yes stop_codon:yes gene_type:complete